MKHLKYFTINRTALEPVALEDGTQETFMKEQKSASPTGNHISNGELEELLERFVKENPQGDSRELAEFMFNVGFEAGEQGGLDENFKE